MKSNKDKKQEKDNEKQHNNNDNQTSEIIQEEETVRYPPLDIMAIVKGSQSQNGLKHGDYKRYRQYCTKRLKRIRKGMKFSFGRKYQKKIIDLDTIQKAHDERILHVLLYNTERSWAYAMNLKQEFSSIKKENLRMRFHIKKKFSKAYKWAKILERGCQKHTEKKTALEAEAYADYMAGCYFFEIDKWEDALNSFIKSRKIYSELAKISDSLQIALFQEKLEQIDQSIRLCNYKLKIGTDQSIDQLADLKTRIQDPSLYDKFNSLIQEQRQHTQGAILTEIQYHGLKLPIKNEKVLELMQKIDVLEKGLRKIDESKIQIEEEKEESNILNAYIELFSLYDDAIKQVNKDKEEAKAVEATKQIYIKMSNYFTSRKLNRVIEKNRLQVKTASSRYEKEGGLENIWIAKKNLKYKGISTQDLVKLYDNLLQTYRQLLDIEASNPEYKEIKAIELKELAFRFLRVFYVACTHISYGRLLEGYSLLANLENEYQKLKDYSKNYGIELNQLDNELCNQVDAHAERIGTLKVRSHVQILNQRTKDQEILRSKIETMNLEGKSQNKLTILDLLKNNKFASEELPNITDDITNIPLAEFPPKLTQVSCKPIFLDLGYSYLEYPKMENKVKAEKKGGFFGFFKKG